MYSVRDRSSPPPRRGAQARPSSPAASPGGDDPRRVWRLGQPQLGSGAGKVEPALLRAQQFPEPVPSHSRSAPGSGAMPGSGAVPLPVTVLNAMWFWSGLGSMPSPAHWDGLRWKALHRLATMMPNELLPCTWLWSTWLASAATTAIPLPDGTAHTSPPGVHVLALLLARTRLWSIRLPEFDGTARNGRVNDKIPAVSPVALLWSSRSAELFSISNPLTLPAAVLWSTRTSWDWP